MHISQIEDVFTAGETSRVTGYRVNCIYPSQDRKRWLALIDTNNEISDTTKYLYEKNLV